MFRTLWCVLAILFFSNLRADSDLAIPSKHAITHAIPGARFGDQILGYAQARYLSYLTSIPFLYKPFLYSDLLTIDFQAQPYHRQVHQYQSLVHIHSANSLADFFCRIRDPNAPPTLFIVEYFPTNIYEWDVDKTRAILLNIPWEDPGFHNYLKQSLLPRIPTENMRKEGCLNVADHIRTLSGNDNVDTIAPLPLKFPNLAYHRRQIQRIYEWNFRNPMHVFLFSDTKNPKKLIEDFRQNFEGTNITFEIQFHDRPDTDHAVQDFFAMQQFDVLIATQSNFSMMAWRLGDFDMVIYPVHILGQYPDSYIDRVQVLSKKSDWFPYDLDVILKEDITKTNHDWFSDVQR